METSTLPPKEEGQAPKVPRFRSVAYPSTTLEFSVALITEINKIFGNLTYTSREAISRELDISDSQLQTQLSTGVQYGLLELKPKEGYKPTPLFTRIYKPLPTENKIDALVEAFESPELYQVLIKQYDGLDLPQVGGLATILYRNHKVSDTASALVAKVFTVNAKWLGLLNEDGFFKVTRSSTPEVLDFVEVEDKSKDEQKDKIIHLPPPPPEVKKNIAQVKIPVLLDDGGIAEIVLPNGIKKVDLERLLKVINAYL